MMMSIKFTYCKNFASAETMETEWEKFAGTLSTFRAYPNKDASIRRAAFVGGIRADEDKGRADGNIVARTVATLDFDAPQGSLIDIEFQLGMMLSCAFVAYSTFRHTPETPRFRLCIPLSRPVNEAEYKAIVQQIVDTVGLGPVDHCSFVMSQLMFLPSNRDGVTPWSLRQDAAPWEVEGTEMPISVRNEINMSGGTGTGPSDDGADDLLLAVANQPLDMTREEVIGLLENYPAEGKDYDEWLGVGMALWHQFGGSEQGYAMWEAWSERSAKHDDRHMSVKWRSFDSSRSSRPKTLASIIKLAGGRRAVAEIAPSGNTFAALKAEATGLTSFEEYTSFRNKVQRLDNLRLPPDTRSMLASISHEVFAKAAGIGLREIKTSFKPIRGKGKGKDNGNGETEGFFGGDAKVPEWAKDYVYCAGEYTFERISTRHSLKPAAFQLCFAGENEVLDSEMDAVTYITKNQLIETVDAKMYWPGFAQIFTVSRTGLSYLNTYEKDGVEPCEALDDEGRDVIDRFMRHLAMTVALEAERQIILDFMAFVYQNPGKRVHWALLIKGIEGNGKSYFFNIMQRLMGRQTSVVTTLAIESNFTSWAEGSILACVEEIYIQGVNKYVILNKMKPMLTDDQIAVLSKNKNERTVPNFTSYMMFTNHADAIPVGDNDRRYCVISTRQTRKEDLFNELGGGDGVRNYFDRLFDDLKRRPDAFARFFTDYEISADFSAAGRAPETEGLADMKSMHVYDDRDNIETAIEKYAREDVVSPDIVDVTYLNRMALLDGVDMPKTSRLAHILSDMGLVQIEGRKCKINKVEDNHIIWYRRGAISSSGQGMSSDLAKKLVRSAFNNDKDFDQAPF
jgi:hypothetical protein